MVSHKDFEGDPGYLSVGRLREELDHAVGVTSDSLFKFILRPVPKRLENTARAHAWHVDVFRRAVEAIFSLDEPLETKLMIVQQFVALQDEKRRQGPLSQVIGNDPSGEPRDSLVVGRLTVGEGEELQEVDTLDFAEMVGEESFAQQYPAQLVALYEARLMKDLDLVASRVYETPIGHATILWTKFKQDAKEHGPDVARAAGAVAAGVLIASGVQKVFERRK